MNLFLSKILLPLHPNTVSGHDLVRHNTIGTVPFVLHAQWNRPYCVLFYLTDRKFSRRGAKTCPISLPFQEILLPLHPNTVSGHSLVRGEDSGPPPHAGTSARRPQWRRGATFEGKITNTALMLLVISGNLGNSQDIITSKTRLMPMR